MVKILIEWGRLLKIKTTLPKRLTANSGSVVFNLIFEYFYLVNTKGWIELREKAS
jgi:hypothetical protein